MNHLLPLIPTHAEIDNTVTNLLNREEFSPDEALAIATVDLPDPTCDRIELAILRHVLHLAPGQTVCGARSRDSVCLEPQGHTESGAWHRGLGSSWSL